MRDDSKSGILTSEGKGGIVLPDQQQVQPRRQRADVMDRGNSKNGSECNSKQQQSKGDSFDA